MPTQVRGALERALHAIREFTVAQRTLALIGLAVLVVAGVAVGAWITRPQYVPLYSGLAGASMAGHAATPHVVYGPHEVLEGPDVEGIVVVSFPTTEEAKAWYDSPGYTAARQHRFKGAEYRVVLVQGL